MRKTNGHPTVVLADDNDRVLLRVCRLLSPAYEVIEMVGDGSKAAAAIKRFDPDVAILDISMPGLDGFGVVRELRRVRCNTRVVFLTIHEDEDYVSAAIESGANGYVLKRRMRSELIHAIEEALAGRRFVSSYAAVKE